MYHDIMRRRASEIMATNRQWYQVVADVYRRLHEGFYPADYVKVIMQCHRGSIDMIDAFFFAKVHAGIFGGDILLGMWEVGATPSADERHAENQTKLRELSRYNPPLDARYDPSYGGSGADGDGSVSWQESVELDRCVRVKGSDRHVRVPVHPCHIPLEVGSTQPTTTFYHLIGGTKAVARWPYGSTWLTILCVAPHAFDDYSVHLPYPGKKPIPTPTITQIEQLPLFWA